MVGGCSPVGGFFLSSVSASISISRLFFLSSLFLSSLVLSPRAVPRVYRACGGARLSPSLLPVCPFFVFVRSRKRRMD
jgi:hypothetical protein